jgi:transposase
MTMKATNRRSFTDDFKREAVSLLASSGRPLTQIASELGIQPSMLRSWRGTVNGDGKRMASAAGSLSAAAPSAEQTEIRRLRRELERAQMERDILKRMARPVCKQFLRYDFCQSASTYPACGLGPGQDGDPRVPVLIKVTASERHF